MINTKQVHDRRKLRFESVDEAIADAELLAEAERQGRLERHGNWTLGQTLGHLAYWANVPYDGYPPMPRTPWLLRLMRPLLRPYILNKGLPAGVRIRGAAEGTYGTEELETERGLATLRKSFARLAAEAPTLESPAFGRMSHEEWRKFHLRHAELHLSFFSRSQIPNNNRWP
jgi:hypothetical protein